MGVIFGLVAIAPMLKMEFEDKQAALMAAFIHRFGVGLLIPNALPTINPILRGVVLGILLSLPDAIITKVYKPIMILGAVGGLVIGIITELVL